MSGVYFPRSLTRSGLVATFCALGSSLCLSPSVAPLDPLDPLDPAWTPGALGGGTLVTLFVNGSSDCLDLAAASLGQGQAQVQGINVTVVGQRSGPGLNAGPPIALFCRFNAASVTYLPSPTSSLITVAAPMASDGALLVEVPVSVIDLANQRVGCVVPGWGGLNSTPALLGVSVGQLRSVAVDVSLVHRYLAAPGPPLTNPDGSSSSPAAANASGLPGLAALLDPSLSHPLPLPPARLTYWRNASAEGAAALQPYWAAGLLQANSSSAFGGSADPLSAQAWPASVRTFCSLFSRVWISDMFISVHDAMWLLQCLDCPSLIGLGICWKDCNNDMRGLATTDQCGVCSNGRYQHNRYFA
jgi:hypothetical protein